MPAEFSSGRLTAWPKPRTKSGMLTVTSLAGLGATTKLLTKLSPATPLASPSSNWPAESMKPSAALRSVTV